MTEYVAVGNDTAEPDPVPAAEIIYNPLGDANNGIEADRTTLMSLRTGVATATNRLGIRWPGELQPSEDGKIHLTTQLGLAALYGWNEQARLQVSTERLTSLREQLARAILQKISSRSDEPNEKLTADLLEDASVLRGMLQPNYEDGKIAAFKVGLLRAYSQAHEDEAQHNTHL